MPSTARTSARYRSTLVLLALAGSSVLLAAPLVAQAASSARASSAQRQAPARVAAREGSSICGKVSTAAVSAIVGYAVPTPTAGTVNIKATKTNDEISAVVTACTYGPETSLAALKKDVILQIEVTSRPLTSKEFQDAISTKTIGVAHFNVKPYSGLGVPGFYLTFTESGISAETISGVQGTSEFGASVYNPAFPQSKLAALAKLARTL